MSSDYASVQTCGRDFARDYFGRLNATGRARSVTDMFAERVRFYAMDAQESRPAVGRADAVEALRRFCRAYGGGEPRRYVTVVSVDARKDHDDYDDQDGDGPCLGECCATARRPFDRYELFVRAQWTAPAAAPPRPPVPFVQTFRVRRPRDADGPLEILSTTVKTTPAAADHAHDFLHSDDTDYNTCTTLRIQSNDKRISSHKKQLNAGDKECKPSVVDNVTTTPVFSRPASTSTRPSYSGEKPPGTQRNFGNNGAGDRFRKRLPPYSEFQTYQKRVETFLKSDDGCDEKAPPARLCVVGLDASFTANDLYDAFGRFGTVLWVRIVPADEDDHGCAQAADNRQMTDLVRRVGHVCFERAEALEQTMNEQRLAHGCIVRGIRLPVRKFVKFDQ